MKKIFVLTGEPSGDKLASKVIGQLKKSRSDIEYLSVGGEHLNALGIRSLYKLEEVTYLGFTKVLLNVFKITRKINKTVKEIIKFNPDILFSVDSPDFTLRVAKEVKKNNPNIKTIHFVSPQVWVWREHRIKKLKSFLDHVLLLFPFEKKFFDKEGIQSTFTGHPLLEEEGKSKVDINQIVKDNNYSVDVDSDGTENVSPNLKLVNEVLVERLLPFSDTFDKFMMARSKRVYRLIKWLLRKRIAKMSFKYSNSRNEENFIKYKTYRLIVLSKN